MIKHFAGELGYSSIYCSFDYDDSEFILKSSFYKKKKYFYLKYVGNESRLIVLPEGCTCCTGMFEGHSFKNKDSLKNFDTSLVVEMNYMFEECGFPKGFTLGDKFDTSKVINMIGMFHECILPKGFTLGDKFDTSRVINMKGMFYMCYSLPEGFTLGNKFDTSRVINMSYMFYLCNFPEGFTLGDKFDTSRVTDMGWMFNANERYKFPEGFTLGDKFDTSKVTDMNHIFYMCNFPEGFILGDKFDTSKVINMCNMFYRSKFPEGFTLGDKFDTSKVTDMNYFFAYCKLPEGFTLGDKFDTSRVTEANRTYMFHSWEFYKCKSQEDVSKKSNKEKIKDADGKNKDYINCKKELLKLLKDGKSIEEAKTELSCNIKPEVLESVSKEIVLALSVSCVKDVNIFFTKKNGTSKYTVGEIRKKLIEERGYPGEIVNKCIVDYLENQYLCD